MPIAKPVAAQVWSEHKTDDGNTYWYNASTNVSQVLTLSILLLLMLSAIYDYIEYQVILFLYPEKGD
jgi:hypothetical protein